MEPNRWACNPRIRPGGAAAALDESLGRCEASQNTAAGPSNRNTQAVQGTTTNWEPCVEVGA
jgi:hypothetical protein